jgi:polysaccharide biosynthesis transport protein
MSPIQLLRILWAWRWLTAVATLSCLAGAAIVVLVVPPRWEGHSRVMLNLMKPDPVTGQVVSPDSTDSYVATQLQLILDSSVAARAVDQMGWLSDPALIKAYAGRSKKDTRDFRHWLAEQVIEHTKVSQLWGSNIIDITYTAATQDSARRIADAVRTAYLDTSLDSRQETAVSNANWFADQVNQLKAKLDAAQSAQAAFERDNGIVMQDDKTDVDTARLRAFATQAAVPPVVAVAPMSSPASIQLAQVDAQIAQDSQALGPNNPQLQQLRAQRGSLAALVAQDQAAARAAAAAAAGGAGALDRAIASQKSRVIAQSDKLAKLTQLQSQVDILRDQYNKAVASEADLRQQAAVVDTGLEALGPAVASRFPVFPNKSLIAIGSLGLGLGTGVLASLLAELLGRRIRGVEDLTSAIDAPLLAVIGPTRGPRPMLSLPSWPGRGNEARA